MSVALALDVASAGLSYMGARKKGSAARRRGKIQRMLSEKAAKESVATAQRASLEERRQAELLASRALAVAAASGGGADDPTVTKIISDIKGEGAYRAAVAMYEGESKAEKLRTEGKLAEAEGESLYQQSKLSNLGTLLETGTSMYKDFKYG